MNMKRLTVLLITLLVLITSVCGVQSLATVTTLTFSNTYTASGSATQFTFNFPVINSAAVVVSVNGVVQTSGYTVTLNPTTVGGTVTFGTAPVASSTVLITRVTPLTQTSALTNEGVLPAATLENMSDKLTEISQELAAQVEESGGGTVTSVALQGDGTVLNSVVAGSPVTVSGSFNPTLKAQNPNTVFCNATTGTAAPTFVQGTTNGTFFGMSGGVLGFYSTPAGSGTVTSVGLTPDNVLYSSVANSPVTVSGSLAPQLKTQLANTVFANATAGAAVPSFVQGSTNGTFLGMQGGVLGFFTPPSVSGGTVSNVSTVSTPSWLTSTWATSTTTPAQTIASATGLTSNQFLGTESGSTLNMFSITTADLPTIPLNTFSFTGALPIASGGTNNASLPVTSGGVYYADGTRFQQVTGTGLLQLNGTSAPTVVSGSSTLQEVTVTITQAQLQAIHGTPIQVVAPTSGSVNVISSGLVEYPGGTTYGAGGTGLQLQYGTSGANITGAIGTSGLLTSAVNYVLYPITGTSAPVGPAPANTGVYLTSSANYTGGSASVTVKVLYSVI